MKEVEVKYNDEILSKGFINAIVDRPKIIFDSSLVECDIFTKDDMVISKSALTRCKTGFTEGWTAKNVVYSNCAFFDCSFFDLNSVFVNCIFTGCRFMPAPAMNTFVHCVIQ